MLNNKVNLAVIIVLTAIAGIAVGMVVKTAPWYGMGPGMMGAYGPGYGSPGIMRPDSVGAYGGYAPGFAGMMGPGMMGGYGPEFGGMMGPGMMGGYGPEFGGMMGPGMMGGYGPGFGGMMGPGMMGGYGPGFGGMMGPGMIGGYRPGYGMGVMPVLAMLDLDQKQQQKIQDIQDQTRKKNLQLAQQLRQQYARLNDLYASGSADPKQMKDQQQQLFDLQRQMIGNRAEAHRQMIGTLTDKQKEKLQQHSMGW